MNQKYTVTQKQTLVERYLSGEPVSCIIAETSICRSTLYGWIKQCQEKKYNGGNEISLFRFQLLENKVKRLEGIIEILKTANCTTNAPIREKLNALESLYGQYNVHMLCDALDVSRGTFYNHILRSKRNNTWYAKRREELRLRIQQVYDESNQIFGAGKITAVLKGEGYRTSVEMVRELMRDMGLASIRQDAKALYDKEQQKYKNHLNQQFNTDQPNQVWVGDVTYFKYDRKGYYICVILDLYSRMVVGYKIGKANSTQLVKATFKQAYENRKPNQLIFHTDRGSNFRSRTFSDYLKTLQITQSFSRAHMPYDNSVIETFFSSMKREELYRTKYRSEKEFITAVNDYIIFYNTKRPHVKNAYKTPEQKEREYIDKQAVLISI